MGLPSFLTFPVEWAIDARIDPDWSSLDALEHPRRLPPPDSALPRHRGQDRPISDSDALAAELSRWVTYYRVPKAGHTESWNVGSRLYDRRLIAFLRRVGA
jgi:hypothetical protein